MDYKAIGIRIKRLINYLGISPTEFCTRTNLSNQSLLKNYISGENIPTLKTIDKIYNKYPIRLEWLLFGKGKMWEVDYFKNRFSKTNPKPLKDTDMIPFLMDVYECNQSQLANRLKVHRVVISDALNERKEMTADFKHRLYREINNLR